MYEFVEAFHETMPHGSKLTALRILSADLKEESGLLDLLMLHLLHEGLLDFAVEVEQRVNRIKNAIKLLGEL
jgi:hypothetical protein